MARQAIYLLIALDVALMIWGQVIYSPNIVTFPPPPTMTPVMNNSLVVFVGEPFNIAVGVGVRVTINCSKLIDALNMSNPIINWIRTNERRIDFLEINRSLPHVYISNDNRHLIINNTILSDGGQLGNEGKYTCEVCNNTTDCRNLTTCVVICGSPNILAPTMEPTVNPFLISMECGQDVTVDSLATVGSITINCQPFNGSGPLVQEVYKDGELIQNGTNLMLVISPVSDDDFGTYTFALSTKQCGTATAVSRIIRQADPPDIDEGPFIPPPHIVMPGNMTVTIGTPSYIVYGFYLTLVCDIVNGTRPITIMWLRNDAPYPAGGNQSVITIPSTDYNNGDVFTCRADNIVGYDMKNTTINTCQNIGCTNRSVCGVDQRTNQAYQIFPDTTLSFTKPSFSVNENNGPAQPVLVLSQPAVCCSTISVWVNIEEDTTKEGEDFTAKSPVRVLFPGGHTRAHFDVLMVDNVKLEANEKFIVSIDPLSLPYGVVLGDHPTAEVVIMDDDESIVSFETTRYEVEEGDGHVELTIALTEGVPFHASLELQTIDDTTTTTTGECDYEDGPYDVSIPVGVTTFKYSLPIFNDDVYEIDETFMVEIASSNHSQIKISRSRNTADVTVINDEEPISVSFSQTKFTVNEHHGVVTANMTLSRPTPCCLHLYVEVEDITATRAIDYGEFDTTQYIVSFPAGTSCSSFDIPIIDDIASEEDETFRVTIVDMSLPFGTRLGDNITADVVIEDNDNYISFSSGTYKQRENIDKLCIKLTFDKPALFSTTVEVFDDSGTASRGVDYAGGPYNVSITEGDMSAVFCIDITDDNDLEEDEIFNLRINTGHPDIIPMSPDQATVTILDNEYVFCFIERVYTVYEGDGFVLVTLNFSRPLPYDSNVWFRYNDAVSNGNHTDSTDVEVDYYTAYAWPNFDTVEKGSVNYTLNIIIMNDNKLEDNRLFSITAMSGTPSNGHTPCTTDVIILDDDDFRLEFESQSYSVSSKNRPDTPVLRLHYPEEYNPIAIFPINVTVHEINGSAYGGVDYVPQTYFRSFEDNDTTYRLIISPIDDNIVEPDETYNLTFTFVPKHGRVIPGENHTTTITIYDDDVCYVSIVKVNGKDTLDFSKQLATYVEVNIAYDGNQHNVITFTAEETRTKNRSPLPISPTERINRIDVHVPREFESMIGNVRPGRAYKNEYNFIFVEFDL